MFFTKKYKKLLKENNRILKTLTGLSEDETQLRIGDSVDTFLVKNKMERMDANRDDLFDKSRCLFHLDRYRFACEYTEDKIVLDCASGTGYGADLMFHLGRAKEVYGIEVNAEACAYAKQTYSSDNVHFSTGSILQLPFEDEKFDVFTSFETIEHIENESKQLSEVKRVLKNGGLYILSTPNDWSSNTQNRFHVRTYTYESLTESIGHEFKILRIYNQNSGTENRMENKNQHRGFVKTTLENHHLAECFVIVAQKI